MGYLKIGKRILELERSNARLLTKNIIMQIELETIAEAPESERARAIIAKWRKHIDGRKEREQAGQN